jgi:hypothetical protein
MISLGINNNDEFIFLDIFFSSAGKKDSSDIAGSVCQKIENKTM